jgi:hypothetical protein
VKAVLEGAFLGLITVAALGLLIAGVAIAMETADGWLDWTIIIGFAAYVATRAGLHEWRNG